MASEQVQKPGRYVSCAFTGRPSAEINCCRTAATPLRSVGHTWESICMEFEGLRAVADWKALDRQLAKEHADSLLRALASPARLR